MTEENEIIELDDVEEPPSVDGDTETDDVEYDDDDEREDDIDKISFVPNTKNALATEYLGLVHAPPHLVKVSIVGTKKVGMACAIAILMRRIASEVCLIDQNSEKVSAQAEDIQHAGVFLGCPLVSGTSEFYKVKDSMVVVIAVCEQKPDEKPDVRRNVEVFEKIVPTIAKLAFNAVLVVATEPIDVMSYIAWKLSKFPTNRVIGTGTLLNSSRFQDLLSRELGLAHTSISCMNIGEQGDTSVPIWSNVNVAGTKICDINSRMGEQDDPEKWHDISEAVNKTDAELNRKKGENGPSCWALGFCTAEIVDAIVRNTKVILPVSTYIYSCFHGTDKEIFISLPCVLGREGVHAILRQTLNQREKTALQGCADNIRNVLRESGILRCESTDDASQTDGLNKKRSDLESEEDKKSEGTRERERNIGT